MAAILNQLNSFLPIKIKSNTYKKEQREIKEPIRMPSNNSIDYLNIKAKGTLQF